MIFSSFRRSAEPPAAAMITIMPLPSCLLAFEGHTLEERFGAALSVAPYSGLHIFGIKGLRGSLDYQRISRGYPVVHRHIDECFGDAKGDRRAICKFHGVGACFSLNLRIREYMVDQAPLQHSFRVVVAG